MSGCGADSCLSGNATPPPHSHTFFRPRLEMCFNRLLLKRLSLLCDTVTVLSAHGACLSPHTLTPEIFMLVGISLMCDETIKVANAIDIYLALFQLNL